jgi:hypothetical protein
MHFASSFFQTLNALLDRLIPADESAGALAAGVDRYVLGQLAGDCAHEAAALARGIAQLDAEAAARCAGSSFVALPVEQQDQLLVNLEKGQPATVWPDGIGAAAFFNRMVDLAHEGFYADPANGGNRDAVSWRMIGYDPHLPEIVPPAHS